MNFTVNTKALKNAIGLGIIKANISNYYFRSNVVQITATRNQLKINVQASGIKTRILLGGSGDEDSVATIIVDCSTFKSLVDSIDNDVLTIEFIPGGIYIHAGTSKFAISQILDAGDVQLEEPVDEYTATSTVTIKPADWQFVKEHQMYAIATKDAHPVYKNAWVGTDGDVIIGDFDLSMFTYSKRGGFDTTCLLPTSLINLFTSIPEGSTVSKIGRNYILSIDTDSYNMITEFAPKYEDDEAVGSYNSTIILNMLKHPESFITLDVGAITKYINQTSIVSQSDLDKVFDFTVKGEELTLSNATSSYVMQVAATAEESYTVKFNSDLIKRVLSNFDSDKINIAPMTREIPNGSEIIKRTIGCIFWTDSLTTVLAGMG